MDFKTSLFAILSLLSLMKEGIAIPTNPPSRISLEIGFGTYLLTGDEGAAAMEKAASFGYQIIDTATYYKNFAEVASMLKKFGRERFYLISKVWHDKQSPSDLQEDLDHGLKELQTDYLDAYLLHWPNSKEPIEKTLRKMEELRQQKKIRHIGLSNVTAHHVRRALEVGVPISCVQVEMHPFFYDAELIRFCQEHSIAVQAWAPFARGRVCNDPLLSTIGRKYGKTASQVAIRWILQHGCIPLPSSKKEEHMQENRDVFDFALSAEEMEKIDARALSGKRERVTKNWIGFDDEFDFSYEECWRVVN